jgi:hypothetical protein
VGSGRQTSALRDGAILDVSRRQWHPLPAAPLPALIGPVAVTDATDHVILMGGEPPRPGRGSANEPLASWLVASYDPANGTWRRLPSLPAVRDHDVDGVNAVAWGKRILVAETWQHTVRTGPSSIEGSGGVDLFLLDPATGRWSTFSARPSAPLVGADLRPLGSFLVVAGGTTCPPMADCAFALDEAVSIVDDRGRASSAVPDSPVQLRAETAVGSSYAVMTGSQFTGRGRVEQPGDTAALDLATKRWVVLPSARRFKPDPESLTWTGRELIAVSPTGLIALEAQ